MKPVSISVNIRNFFQHFQELPYLIFWGLIYWLGRHPDAPWGDGLGYAIAVQNGFDLACNANSHFAYLNFFALLLQIFDLSDALHLLGMGSVFWACVSLLIASRIAILLSGRMETGIICLQILASSFAFWRLASIPEVYTMELAFFAACLYSFLKWCRSPQSKWFYIFALVHAIGLLVHIHLIFLFSLYPLAFLWFKKPLPWPSVFLYLVPALVFFFSVEVLKLNSWAQLLFENQQEQLLSFSWHRLIRGPFFVGGILIYMLPVLLFLPFLALKRQIPFSNQDFQVGLLLFLSFFFFASLYPDPGIFVFLLPVFLLLALAISRLLEGRQNLRRIALLIPVFQTAAYLLLFFGLKTFAPESWQSSQKIKGGPGFVSLPWAKGNVASVLEICRGWPADSIPEGMQWNSSQVAVWDSLRLLHQKPEGK
jgi:hypothetical protein